MKIIKSMKTIKSVQKATPSDLETTIIDFSQAKDFDSNDIMDLGADVMINPVDQDTAMPWDAGFEVKGQAVNIEGGLSDNGFGSCKVSLPKNKAAKFYMVNLIANDEDDHTKVRDFLASKNVKYK